MKPDGTEMTDADWKAPGTRTVSGMKLPGDQITQMDEQGERISGITFAILLQRRPASRFRILARRARARPCAGTASRFDTAAPNDTGVAQSSQHTGHFPLQAHSLAVLRAEVPSTT